MARMIDGTVTEASHGSHEFYRDRARITKRLIETRHLRVGYFGASTGAAAALVAAAARPDAVDAIVSRGGRLDLAGPALAAHVRAPTLLIVGEQRRPRHRAESRGIRAAAVRKAARHRPGGDAPVRGARGPGSGRQPGARVVRAPPHGRASPRGGHRAGIGAAPGPGSRHSLGPATSGAGAAPRSERPGWER
jgi:dienelactone hydrolase